MVRFGTLFAADFAWPPGKFSIAYGVANRNARSPPVWLLRIQFCKDAPAQFNAMRQNTAYGIVGTHTV